jgi:hypothetical protein
MSESPSPNPALPNGHRWLRALPNERLQYLSGAVDGMRFEASKLRAAIDIDLMVALDLPEGVAWTDLADWAKKFKAAVGPESELLNTTLGELADALTQIYSDDRNLDILIVAAMRVAAAIANGAPEGGIQGRLELLRHKGN